MEKDLATLLTWRWSCFAPSKDVPRDGETVSHLKSGFRNCLTESCIISIWHEFFTFDMGIPWEMWYLAKQRTFLLRVSTRGSLDNCSKKMIHFFIKIIKFLIFNLPLNFLKKYEFFVTWVSIKWRLRNENNRKLIEILIKIKTTFVKFYHS